MFESESTVYPNGPAVGTVCEAMETANDWLEPDSWWLTVAENGCAWFCDKLGLKAPLQEMEKFVVVDPMVAEAAGVTPRAIPADAATAQSAMGSFRLILDMRSPSFWLLVIDP